MTKEQMIQWIDNATLFELLRKWRFAEAGDPFCKGDVGDYFSKIIGQKRDQNNEEWVRCSKQLGW